MKQIFSIIILIIFYQLSLQAQFFSNTIIKTRPFQDVVAHNPTLGLEKAIHNIYSVEMELMYRNRNWNSSGSEGDFGKFYNGDGFRILVGSKMYFGKSNRHLNDPLQKAPFGWFTTIQLAFNYAITYDIEKRESVSGIYKYTVDSNKNWLDINIGIGRQFFLFERIIFEFYVGPSYRAPHTEKMIVVEGEDLDLENENYNDGSITPFVALTIGYYID